MMKFNNNETVLFLVIISLGVILHVVNKLIIKPSRIISFGSYNRHKYCIFVRDLIYLPIVSQLKLYNEIS